jgi:hypothetical protein
LDLLQISDKVWPPLFGGVLKQSLAKTDDIVYRNAHLIVQVGNQGGQTKDDIVRGKFVGVQEVADDLQELLAGGVNQVQSDDEIRLTQTIGVSLQQFTVTDNRVQRCP